MVNKKLCSNDFFFPLLLNKKVSGIKKKKINNNNNNNNNKSVIGIIANYIFMIMFYVCFCINIVYIGRCEVFQWFYVYVHWKGNLKRKVMNEELRVMSHVVHIFQ